MFTLFCYNKEATMSTRIVMIIGRLYQADTSHSQYFRAIFNCCRERRKQNCVYSESAPPRYGLLFRVSIQLVSLRSYFLKKCHFQSIKKHTHTHTHTSNGHKALSDVKTNQIVEVNSGTYVYSQSSFRCPSIRV